MGRQKGKTESVDIHRNIFIDFAESSCDTSERKIWKFYLTILKCWTGGVVCVIDLVWEHITLM